MVVLCSLLKCVCFSPLAPTAAPFNASIEAVDETSALMNWTPPPSEHLNGLLRGYLVVVNGLETTEVLEKETVNTSLLLTDLHPFNTYQFVVAARTVGLGPFSRPLTFQMPEAGNCVSFCAKYIATSLVSHVSLSITRRVSVLIIAVII